MLSTNSPSSILRRRAQHRRQNSTPAAFEAPTVRPLSTNPQQRHQRSGMSLDLRGLNLDTTVESLRPEGSTVSNTNLGQAQQHFMQVAQPHSQPQPGFRDPFMNSSVHQSLSSPRTPQRPPLRTRSPSLISTTPLKPPPSEQELKGLYEHIQAVYGSCGQVFINILPTPASPGILPSPTGVPQKVSRLSHHEALEPSPNFNEMPNINLAPTRSAMAFDLENPEADVGYESSSYYTSPNHSPSPRSSPRQKPMQPFLEGIQEEGLHAGAFPQPQTLFPHANFGGPLVGPPLPMPSMPYPSLSPELQGEASLEYTGISPEEVQRYISEQDPITSKWTCLYPDCGKIFGRRENIRSHVQTHLGDRQYRCNGCGKCFVRQHDLKRHAKIHSGNKEYVCPCGSGFARQDALTRHRQRGMCSGGFPDAVRRQAKRGRPKKNRPEMEERAHKANRARRALASAASSVSAESPQSEAFSSGSTPQPVESEHDVQTVPPFSFNTYPNPSSGHYSYESSSSSFTSSQDVKPSTFTPSGLSDGYVTSFNVLQQRNTPPLSPSEQEPSAEPTNEIIVKHDSSPSRLSVKSNPFSTPPTSPPPEQKDQFEDIFAMNENTCSQFELEMGAMADTLESALTPLDDTPYEFLEFPA